MLFINYLENIKDLEFDKKYFKERKKRVIENNDTLDLQEQIEKLNKKKKDMTELFSTDEIDYETFKEVKSVVDSKLEVLNNELDKINKYSNEEDLTNEEIIKEVIVNLKIILFI